MINSYLGLGQRMPLLVLILVIWTLFWKGFALWTAAKRNQKVWFLVLLIVNTIGILEIIYIFVVAKKKLSDIDKSLKGIFPATKNKEKGNPPEEKTEQ